MANNTNIIILVEFERDVQITQDDNDIITLKDCLRFNKSDFFDNNGKQIPRNEVIQDAIQARVVEFRKLIRKSRLNPTVLTPAQKWAYLTQEQKLELKSVLADEGI